MADSARQAFVNGIGLASLVGAVVVITAAIVAWRLLPASYQVGGQPPSTGGDEPGGHRGEGAEDAHLSDPVAPIPRGADATTPLDPVVVPGAPAPGDPEVPAPVGSARVRRIS